MPAPFPHVYHASVSRTFPSRGRVDVDGDTAAWSPEHLVLSSLGMCMLTTFEAFAARAGIELVVWRTRLTGTVDRTPEGPAFTSIVLGIEMEITGNVDRVDQTLEDAKHACLVLNSLRVPVVIEAEIRTPKAAEEYELAS